MPPGKNVSSAQAPNYVCCNDTFIRKRARNRNKTMGLGSEQHSTNCDYKITHSVPIKTLALKRNKPNTP